MSMRVKRTFYKKNSNNQQNVNKNVCSLAVAKALKVDEEVRYLHTIHDLIRAARKKWIIRSRKSSFKANTVGSLRKEINKKGDAMAYIVMVPSHVVLLDSTGKTVIDTAPVSRDRRKILHVYAVYTEQHMRMLKAMEEKVREIKMRKKVK